MSKDSSFVEASDGLDNSPFAPVRGRALSDLLASPTDKHPSGLPVLEPIKIRSTENAEDESSESEPEDEDVFEVTNDSDSEPEADREMKRTGAENENDGMKVGFEFEGIVVCLWILLLPPISWQTTSCTKCKRY